jgi:hypothetical protein
MSAANQISQLVRDPRVNAQSVVIHRASVGYTSAIGAA